MSENLISENENTATGKTGAAEAVATDQRTDAADAAKAEGSAAADPVAVIKIEGQEFPLHASIASDDNLLKTALSPHYPSIRNAQITRETRAGQLIVSIVKRAEHKGN